MESRVQFETRIGIITDRLPIHSSIDLEEERLKLQAETRAENNSGTGFVKFGEIGDAVI